MSSVPAEGLTEPFSAVSHPMINGKAIEFISDIIRGGSSASGRRGQPSKDRRNDKTYRTQSWPDQGSALLVVQ